MGASFNRVILMGNLTRDVELRYTPGGLGVCDLGLAISDRHKDASGEWTEGVTFVDVSCFGRTAEVAGEFLKKGSPVFIEGKLKLDSWEAQDGTKRSKLKVVCDHMQLLGNKGTAGEAAPRRRQEDPFGE